MNILRLTIKKKFFDMIASGDKPEEYRSVKPYWISRLCWHEFRLYKPNDIINLVKSKQLKKENILKCKFYDAVELKNGYSKTSPTMLVEFKGLSIGKAKAKWSGNWKGDVFRIKLGEIYTLSTHCSTNESIR